MKIRVALYLFGFAGFASLISCSGEIPVPKPKAFPRVEFPKRQHPMVFDAGCPFSFQYPSYAQVIPDQKGDETRCWMNIFYQPFNAKLHLTYKPIEEEGDLKGYLNDAYTMVDKHFDKADAIEESTIGSAGETSGGLYWRIGGNAATPIQFFVTDSTNHFMRGSLYFNSEPNRDSLAPIVNFIEEDIVHTLSTLDWYGQTVE